MAQVEETEIGAKFDVHGTSAPNLEPNVDLTLGQSSYRGSQPHLPLALSGLNTRPSVAPQTTVSVRPSMVQAGFDG